MITIKDPILEPYYIIQNQFCYILMEGISTTGKHHLSQKKSKYNKPLGYYTSFSKIIMAISKEKLIKNEKTFNTIKEYINEWEKIKNELNNIIYE